MYVALDQKYLEEKDFWEIKNKLIDTSRMISGLINYLKQSDLKSSKFR